MASPKGVTVEKQNDVNLRVAAAAIVAVVLTLCMVYVYNVDQRVREFNAKADGLGDYIKATTEMWKHEGFVHSLNDQYTAAQKRAADAEAAAKKSAPAEQSVEPTPSAPAK